MHGTVEKGYAMSSGGQVHYYHQAGPGAPVVCLHQTASSGAMWLKVMDRLRGSRRFIALDTPGFGGSFDPPHLPESIGTYADWLIEALDSLDVNRFHLLGHHTGVCIAADITIKYPSRVLSNAMIGPVPLTADERNEFKKHYSTPISPTPDGAYLKATWDYLQGLGAHDELALHHRELIDTARAYMGRFMAYTNVWRQDWTSLFAQIRTPLLLMCADDDVLWPFFGRARELRPDADAVVLRGANFEPDLDPDGVANAYRAFLARHGL
jgi:pimeloyl-ACP methyl ester carboxylesterase